MKKQTKKTVAKSNATKSKQTPKIDFIGVGIKGLPKSMSLASFLAKFDKKAGGK